MMKDRIIEGLRWRGYRLKERGVGRTWAGRRLVDLLLLPNDVHLIRMRYRNVFGCGPRFFFPRTFNEKIQRAKLFERKARHVLYADKLAVRTYVRDRLGESVLTRLIWTGHDVREAAAAAIRDPFILKDNHGQGAHLIARDPEAFDWDAAIQRTQGWLQRHYDAFAAEWQYRWIKPCFLIEELLACPERQSVPDYKFFCFHGRVQFVQLDIDRFTHHTRAILDRNFTRLPVGLHYPRYTGPIQRPACYAEMLTVAEILSAGEPFLRVDLYDCGRPIFGELTLHPGAGLELFDPVEWDEEFGKWW